MSEFNDWKSDVQNSKADKARAATELGQEAMRRGWSRHEASHNAGHELKHALADTKPGYFGLGHDPVEGEIAEYVAIGPRSPGEIKRIASAPKEMGLRDSAQYTVGYSFDVLDRLWNFAFGWLRKK